jgi:hypothetical protein
MSVVGAGIEPDGMLRTGHVSGRLTRHAVSRVLRYGARA